VSGLERWPRLRFAILGVVLPLVGFTLCLLGTWPLPASADPADLADTVATGLVLSTGLVWAGRQVTRPTAGVVLSADDAVMAVAATVMPALWGPLFVLVNVASFGRPTRWYRTLGTAGTRCALFAAMTSERWLITSRLPGPRGMVVAGIAALATFLLGSSVCVTLLEAADTGRFPTLTRIWPTDPGYLLGSACLASVLILLSTIGFDALALGVLLAAYTSTLVGKVLSERARAAENDRALGEERAALLRTVLAESEREKRVMMAALHDGPLQSMICAQMAASLAADPEMLEELGEDLPDMDGLLQQSVTEMRAIMRTGTGAAVGANSIEEALRLLARDQQIRNPARIELSVDPIPAGLPESTESLLFFVLREAIVNAAKHAQADLVTVAVRRSGDDFVGEVCDNGRGICEASRKAASDSGHLGMRLMRERMAALGGTLTVSSSAEGTKISASVPIAQPDGDYPSSRADGRWDRLWTRTRLPASPRAH
jgi:signal transduction histidine kinase